MERGPGQGRSRRNSAFACGACKPFCLCRSQSPLLRVVERLVDQRDASQTAGSDKGMMGALQLDQALTLWVFRRSPMYIHVRPGAHRRKPWPAIRRRLWSRGMWLRRVNETVEEPQVEAE